ncbi:hypothetical protein CBL_07881 [Carabus blaptoides fortunei]
MCLANYFTQLKSVQYKCVYAQYQYQCTQYLSKVAVEATVLSEHSLATVSK